MLKTCKLSKEKHKEIIDKWWEGEEITRNEKIELVRRSYHWLEKFEDLQGDAEFLLQLCLEGEPRVLFYADPQIITAEMANSISSGVDLVNVPTEVIVMTLADVDNEEVLNASLLYKIIGGANEKK